MENNIYLESGSNDFQMIAFKIGSQLFGVNAIKIKEIIEYKSDNLIKTPHNNKNISGLYLSRGETYPLMDLHYYLEIEKPKTPDLKQIVLIT
jgi:two-component system chemotaxis response regulator CheV